MSELRELYNFERGFDEPASEEVNCFLGIETVADVGSLEGNHSDDRREYFAGNANFQGETYADDDSVRPAALLFTTAINFLIIF